MPNRILRILAALPILMIANATLQAQTSTIGTAFSGQSFNDSGFIPPDTMGSIGPNHFFEMNNGVHARYNKAGTVLNASSMDNFFNSGPGGLTISSFSFDPRLQYDRTSGRWFVSAVDGAGSVNSGILIAASNSSDATGTYSRFRIDADATNVRWADYPVMGISKNWVTVANNMFPVSSGSAQVSLLTIPKASLVAGNLNGQVYSNPTPANVGFTPHPASDLNTDSNPAYTLSAFNMNSNNQGFLQLGTISGNVNAPTVTANNNTFVIVAAQPNQPPTATQPGGVANLNTGDQRFSSTPMLVNGKLWAVHSAGVGGLATTIWYRINPATSTLEAQGTVPAPAGIHSYYPSIAVNSTGDIVVGYSGSNTTTFASAYAVVGRFDGTNTTFGTPTQVQAGSASYVRTDGIGRNRWGDYSSVTLDPADPGSFWSMQLYASATNVWRTHMAEVIPTVTDEVRWQTTANGNFATNTQWNTGTAPTSTSHVIFSRWTTSNPGFTVTMPTGTTSNDRLSVRQSGITPVAGGPSPPPPAPSQVIFSVPAGSTWNLTNTSASNPSVNIAQFQGTASGTFTGGGTFNTQHTSIASENVGVGVLTVRGAGTTWNSTGNVQVGGSNTAAGGTGTLNVNDSGLAVVTGFVRLWSDTSTVNVGTATLPGTLRVNAFTNPAGTNPTVNILHTNSVVRVIAETAPAFTGTVNVSGQLEGTGRLLGPVNLRLGGTIAAGRPDSIVHGDLRLHGGLSLDDANTFLVLVGDSVPNNQVSNPASNIIDLGSSVLSRNTGSGSPDLTTIRLQNIGTLEEGLSYNITIANFASSSNLTLSNFTVDPNGVGFILGNPQLTLNTTSLTIQFTVVPVPEPGTILAFSVIALAGIRRFRRAEMG
ncbi:MAG: hypothetical protein ACRCZF_06365 [Gemmataceae bacterium]